MKKIEIDIPLEAYTDNVRRIIERSLHDLEAEPPYLTSFLCDPKLTEEDLETALHILEKAGTELTKQKFIRAELEARKEVVNPEVFPEDLRKDWEDMRKEKKEMIDEKRLIKECEERLLVGTNVIKLIEEQPKICEWIPLEEKTPENGEHVLLSFANEKQNPLVGTWKVDDEGGAFYAPFTGRTYASLGYFVSAWMPLPEPYKPEDIKEAPWKNRALGNFMKGANR